jgi:hypothetical protein
VEVAQIAASYAQSGLSRSEFCRQHGLSLSTFRKYCPHGRHRDTLPPASLSKSLSAVELPLARVEFVEKSATHTEQHDPLLVECIRPANTMVDGSGQPGITKNRLLISLL